MILIIKSINIAVASSLLAISTIDYHIKIIHILNLLVKKKTIYVNAV